MLMLNEIPKKINLQQFPLSNMITILRSLQQEYRYVHLLYHRNKNQHGSTHWWKEFNMLKRSLQQILKSYRGDITKGQFQYQIRKFLQVRLPQLYRSFQCVITTGQFVTLGVVLVGLLARCHHLIQQLVDEKSIPIPMKKSPTQSIAPVVIPSSDFDGREDLGMDIGEEIIESSIPIEQEAILSIKKPSPQIEKPKKTKKSKKKKSKSKSAIDSIFG